MKTTPEGHGDTAPGELGPPLARPGRELSDAELRSIRRHAEGMVHTSGGYKIWTAEDGKLYTETLK